MKDVINNSLLNGQKFSEFENKAKVYPVTKSPFLSVPRLKCHESVFIPSVTQKLKRCYKEPK